MKIEDLDVFKLSHELTLQVYKVSENFPDDERFGLTSQMRKSSASVPTNFIEGGHIFLSKELGYIEEDTYSEMRERYDRVSMMLTKLHGSLK